MLAKMFVQRNKIDAERTRTNDTMQWICNVKKIMKEVDRLPMNDVQQYCEC